MILWSPKLNVCGAHLWANKSCLHSLSRSNITKYGDKYRYHMILKKYSDNVSPSHSFSDKISCKITQKSNLRAIHLNPVSWSQYETNTDLIPGINGFPSGSPAIKWAAHTISTYYHPIQTLLSTLFIIVDRAGHSLSLTRSRRRNIREDKLQHEAGYYR